MKKLYRVELFIESSLHPDSGLFFNVAETIKEAINEKHGINFYELIKLEEVRC